MAKLRINGDSSGYVDLEAPNAASSQTIDVDQLPQKNAANTFSANTQVITAASDAEALHIKGRSSDDIGQMKFMENDGTTSLGRLDARTTKFEMASYSELHLSANGPNNAHLKIDTSGRVTTPQQPAFWVQRSADYTGYNTGNYAQSVLYDSKLYDTGNNFNTSTGLFTAPVTGHYLFTASAWATGSTTLEQSWITYNGARSAGTDWTSGSNPNGFTQLSAHVKMDANDTVGYHPYSSGNTIGIRSNATHTWFKGILLG